MNAHRPLAIVAAAAALATTACGGSKPAATVPSDVTVAKCVRVLLIQKVAPSLPHGCNAHTLQAADRYLVPGENLHATCTHAGGSRFGCVVQVPASSGLFTKLAGRYSVLADGKTITLHQD